MNVRLDHSLNSGDFSEWAVVARKDDTGFGRMARDIRKVLRIGHHFVCPSDRIEGYPPSGDSEKWLYPDMSVDELANLLTTVQGIIFFETYATWHPDLLTVSSSCNVKTVLIPMWEWFRGDDSMYRLCDLFACPTLFTLNIVRKYGWKNSCYLPWPIDLEQFTSRYITGPAHQFIHNAGLVDHDDRKGTRDVIRAFKKTPGKNLRLLVRLQKEVPLPELDDRITVHYGNLKLPANLYEFGDCAIQPSKMEGIGFMVLEPVASGMPVITSNYPPMNEFVQQPEMLTKLKLFKRRSFPSNWVKHSHLRLASISDLARRIRWCSENDMSFISHSNRAFAESVFEPAHLRSKWAHALSAL